MSSHLGDRAIVYADGRMEGFIGGSAAADIVREAALETLKTGEARLLTIDPMPGTREGAVDVYIEPELARPYFFIAGATPVARALAQLAPRLDFTVVQFAQAEEHTNADALSDVAAVDIAEIDRYLQALKEDVRSSSAAVAASQANYDEPALIAFLKHRIGFIALLANVQRGRNVMEQLAQRRVAPADLSRVHYPAGLDIGAQRPGDVAISILAQVIAERRAPAFYPATALDPVCGMSVEVASSRDRAEFNGRTYYFCGSHCSSAFAAEPEAYTGVVSKSGR